MLEAHCVLVALGSVFILLINPPLFVYLCMYVLVPIYYYYFIKLGGVGEGQ